MSGDRRGIPHPEPVEGRGRPLTHPSLDPCSDACRVDVWLWRARFFKTRALACRFVDAGRVRLTRHGAETRLDKPSRTVRPADRLTFALDGRLTILAIAALGDRRGPASEARQLYIALTPDPAPQATHPD